MAKAKLDYQYCLLAACEPGKRKTDHWDTQIPGFILEARSTGMKTFALRYTDQRGLQRQKRIGSFGVITADQARKAASKLRAEVELGGSPQQQKEDRKAVPTYGEIAADGDSSVVLDPLAAQALDVSVGDTVWHVAR